MDQYVAVSPPGPRSVIVGRVSRSPVLFESQFVPRLSGEPKVFRRRPLLPPSLSLHRANGYLARLAIALNANPQPLWIPELNAIPVDATTDPLGFVPLRHVRQWTVELLSVVVVPTPRREVRHWRRALHLPLRIDVPGRVLRDCGPVNSLLDTRSVPCSPSHVPYLPCPAAATVVTRLGRSCRRRRRKLPAT